MAYWLSSATKNVLAQGHFLSDRSTFKRGMATGDNDKFIRFWFEVGVLHTCVTHSSALKKWHLYNKGGDFRRWYGNRQYVVLWEQDGLAIKTFSDDKGALRSRPQNTQFAYQPCISYSSLTSGTLSVRVFENFIHDQAGNFCPLEVAQVAELAGLLNSKVAYQFLRIFNATLNILTSDLNNIPLLTNQPVKIRENSQKLIGMAKSDWDMHEVSWDFIMPKLISSVHRREALECSYALNRKHWRSLTGEMKRLEEENNRIFIDAYGLQDELTPEVPHRRDHPHLQPRLSLWHQESPKKSERPACKPTPWPSSCPMPWAVCSVATAWTSRADPRQSGRNACRLLARVP